MADFGDRPKFYPNQALALPEIEALRDTQIEDRDKADGAIYGACEGVLTAGATTFEDLTPTVKNIRFGEMVLAGFKNQGGANDRAQGGIVHFIPTAPQQVQTTVNVHGAQSTTGAIWWRPIRVQTDKGNYREVSTGWPKGRWMANNLRERIRVVFAVTANFSTPPINGPWYRLAHLNWTNPAAPPIVTFLHAFDIGRHLSPTVNPLSFIGGLMTHPDYHDPASNNGRSYSTARAISIIGHLLMKLMNGATYSWNPLTGQVTTPGELTLAADVPRGVPQLGDALTEAEDDIEALQATDVTHGGQIADLTADVTTLKRSRNVWSADIAGSDGEIERANGQILAFGVVEVEREGEGTYRVDFPIAIDDGVAMVGLRVGGMGVRNWDSDWIGPGELKICTFNATTGDLLDTNFTLQVSGKL